VLRGFAPGPHRWSAGHRGVDLDGAAGRAVLAAGPGQVSFAGSLAGRGVVVVVHPDGVRTTYEPLEPAVARGQQVTGGQRIGTLVTGGAHCLPSCLHWGALRGESYLDPLSLLRSASPPVLLPLAGIPDG
jgi:murein DD-endopeptidase MepM/ murein hydrolase activator NlpD